MKTNIKANDMSLTIDKLIAKKTDAADVRSLLCHSVTIVPKIVTDKPKKYTRKHGRVP